MMLRILCAVLVAVFLAGCDRDAANSVVPPPVALSSEAMGVFCGMNLLEHPGPKGQIITAGRMDPFWFTSVRDTVAFTLMPDQPRDQAQGQEADERPTKRRGVARHRASGRRRHARTTDPGASLTGNR